MKLIRKRLPYEAYDAAGLEDWLGQMAAQGLHLVKCWESRASFRRGEPAPGTRYRLEGQGFYEIEPDKNEIYAQSGWEYVTTLRGLYLIFRSSDPAAPELHTDPVTQSYTMKSLMKRQRFFLILTPLWLLFCCRDILKTLFTYPALLPMNAVLRNAALILWPVLFLCLGASMLPQIIQYLGLRRLCRRLAAGVPMDRERRIPRSFWRGGFTWLAVVLLFLAIPLGVYWDGQGEKDFPLEDYPLVTLEEVYAPEPVRPDPDQSDWDEAKLKRSLLAPAQVKYSQNGLTEDGEWVQVVLECDRTVSPFTAALVVRGRIAAMEQYLAREAKRADEFISFRYPELLLNSGPYPVEWEGVDELYALDYQFEGTLPRRSWFGRAGGQAFRLTVPLDRAERALEMLLSQLTE